MKLKSEHKPESEIVVDGERVEGYELPPDPRGNARQQRLMREAEALRRERERTAFDRAVERVAALYRRRRGDGFEMRLRPTRGYLDCRRIVRPDYVIYRVELGQLARGGFCVEVWRRK